ncbi:MAG: hypothetical protein OEY11_09990 [Gammaproteobacteria bacterium]|nr:hypothetical protein [Gammaproteobacteria bacterium]
MLLHLSLSACGAPKTTPHKAFANAQGLAFFSITESGFSNALFKLVFINELTKKQITVELKNDDFEIGSEQAGEKDFRSFVQPRGKLVELKLPEGVYSLKQWQANQQKKTGSYSLRPAANKKFKVLGGRALYLGNIHLHSLEHTQSVFIRDRRDRDVALFYNKHAGLDKSELLISSSAFLNPASNREHLFNAYTRCSFSDYQLYSKKRLPPGVEKFRTLQVASEKKKVSRLDGYRLKYKNKSGFEVLNIKVELSDARQYAEDKKTIREWFDGFKSGGIFSVSFEKKSHFSQFQLKNSYLAEKRMLYKVVMFDDDAQMITSLVFVNPPGYRHSYQTIEEFLPAGISAVSLYQQCVVENLNRS